MSSQYKATCKCGATIDVPYSDNFKDWLNNHKECLKAKISEEIEFLDWVHPKLGVVPAQVEGGKPLILRAKLKENSNG